MLTYRHLSSKLRYVVALLFTIHYSLFTASAQSEGGLLAGLEAEKKINKEFSISLEGELRTRNDFKTMDRWKIGLDASYKVNNWLKANAGYSLLDYNNREKVEYYTSEKGNEKIKWRPSYWSVKHRFHASLTGSHKFMNGIKLSLRERWQYTYRPEKETERYKMKIKDQTMTLDDGYLRSGKGKNQLRSRFQIEYDRKRALFTPYASVELYNSWGIEKVRYTAGTDIRLGKQHSLGVYYRFQDIRNADEDDYDPDMHYLGLGYKLKF